MHSENRTVIGIFSDITDAKRATDEMHSKGISTARLVENDLAVTFTGTAEREESSSIEDVVSEQHKTGGIKGFFARLFGREEERSDWKLSSDSESYFQNAYQNKQHLVIIEDCNDVSLCRDIISRLGGVAEEQGGHYYQTERSLQRQGALADAPLDRDESLDSGRRSSADQAADSGLGVDVDRWPFAHTVPMHEENVSDRISQSRLSGTADHIPFTGQSTDTGMQVGSSTDTARTGMDSSLGTGLAVPAAHRSFAGQTTDDSLLASADQRPSNDRPSAAGQDQSVSTKDHDRALDGVSGDADRTPLVGQRSHASADRPLGTSLVGDDRVHDHGLSNADVSRISSDRIMELDEEDQPLTDADKDHILPERSFPPSRSQDTAHP